MHPFALTSHADRLVLSDGGGAATVLVCGPALLAARHWPHTLPTPLQLEQAIDDVEAAIEQTALVQAPRGGLILDETLSGLLAPLLDRGTAVRVDEGRARDAVGARDTVADRLVVGRANIAPLLARAPPRLFSSSAL